MHALHAALAARHENASPAVAALLAELERAGPDVTTMDVLICSFGGVGSTQLSNHLNAYGLTTNLLTDADNLRHVPRPPVFATPAGSSQPPHRLTSTPTAQPPTECSSSSTTTTTTTTSSSTGRGLAPHTALTHTGPADSRDGAGGASAAAAASNTTGTCPAGPSCPSLPRPARPRHVVYLYGDPLAAVASHYRRGHACHQAQKTCGNPTRLSEATFPPTLEAYVEGGEDLFGLEAHFHGWLHTPTDYPVIMVRYECAFQPEVCGPLFQRLAGDRLGTEVARKAAEAFAASHRPRASQVPEDLRGRMYGDLLKEMDELPPLYVRPPSGGKPSP